MKVQFRNRIFLLVMFFVYAFHFFVKGDTFYPLVFKYYLGDLICMPIVLSVVLIGMSLVYSGRYSHLSVFQIALATFLFSVYFEYILPSVDEIYVQDPFDIICYCIGGFVFALFFNPKQKVKSKLPLA